VGRDSEFDAAGRETTVEHRVGVIQQSLEAAVVED